MLAAVVLDDGVVSLLGEGGLDLIQVAEELGRLRELGPHQVVPDESVHSALLLSRVIAAFFLVPMYPETALLNIQSAMV